MLTITTVRLTLQSTTTTTSIVISTAISMAPQTTAVAGATLVVPSTLGMARRTTEKMTTLATPDPPTVLRKTLVMGLDITVSVVRLTVLLNAVMMITGHMLNAATPTKQMILADIDLIKDLVRGAALPTNTAVVHALLHSDGTDHALHTETIVQSRVINMRINVAEEIRGIMT